ncbi:MAG TPA: substrate-binding domain-containing protein [Candidatus Eubacterium faecipullorum]|uniref:Substrate-binding domain-containing protein n=1 Tax=Candidatus Eubacterium faecipullorum TaxID=2838571 RepID=A0A9D1RG75_9FIRM|nr:substrate-binding domain-containing protein [Candidatus Eubacterium faecipullorum]
MKKIISILAAVALMAALFAGCAGSKTSKINVITREDGSGTRSAFIELFGIESENENGDKMDNTVITAETTNSTSVMITSVASDPNAIGYISMGSLGEDVKPVMIDGAAPTVENVENGTYKVCRPFNIAVMDGISQTAQDFIDFIMSEEGQRVVSENGYIPQGTGGAYSGSAPAGTVTVAGSSSVTPVMEKLKEAYQQVNPNAQIVVQQNDSTTGVTSAIDGICDIAMVSRELKESELSAGLSPTTIAIDGIAVIVNPDNPVDSLTSEEVKAIYTGEKTEW